MTKPSIPDGDDTRSGYRSGAGAESALRHLMSTARRRAKHQSGFADSHVPTQPVDDGNSVIDIQLPP